MSRSDTPDDNAIALELYNEHIALMKVIFEKYLKKYRIFDPDGDLFSECTLQFWKCCMDYDKEAGSFGAYMDKSIMGTVLKYVRKNRLIPMPERLSNRHYRIRRLREKGLDTHAIMEQLNLTEAQVEEAGGAHQWTWASPTHELQAGIDGKQTDDFNESLDALTEEEITCPPYLPEMQEGACQ